MEWISQVAVPLLLGGAGWLSVSFVGGPYAEVRNLRRTALEELVFVANVGSFLMERDEDGNLYISDGPMQLWEHAQRLRRLSTKFGAIHLTANLVLRTLLRWHGWDLEKASKNFMGLSNSLSDDLALRIRYRHDIETALGLPHEMERDEVMETWKLYRERRRTP